ncbi:hypothetical protein ACLIKE_06610 [Ferroplasma acidiphilum]|jgi:hypothetical protein|uniref:Uncharacterized protein n=2 Tax=Ferroplasma acidiphilum TaxID=74969 RepID=A0A7K4FR99_9ARCH|nr:hypothetical protein [Ferroplasma acidiphilum]NOL60667.1 hypothetical protein [Ferroplasma acidiphilum]
MTKKVIEYKKRKLKKRERWDIIKILGSSFTLSMIFCLLIFGHMIFLYLSVIPPIMMAFPRGEDGRKPLVTMILLGFAMIFSFPTTEGYLFNQNYLITREDLFIILAMIPQSVYIGTNVRKIVTLIKRPERKHIVLQE